MPETLCAGTIFVVDDDDPVLHSLQFSLGLEGFRVRTFRSAADLLAVDAFPQEACLVVDYRLPGRDGLSVVRALRARGVNTPAIIITTDPSPRVRSLAAEAGISIVEKP